MKVFLRLGLMPAPERQLELVFVSTSASTCGKGALQNLQIVRPSLNTPQFGQRMDMG